MKEIKIIGIGSPFGDDRLGWLAIDMLKKSNSKDIFCDLIVCDRPGMKLLELLHDADEVYLIDAVQADSPVGTIHRFTIDDVSSSRSLQMSSHGFGLVEALQLAQALENLPPKLIIFGIEIGSINFGINDFIHPLIQSALQKLITNIPKEF